MTTPLAPGRFRSRPTHFTGLSEINGWSLKRYGITLDDGPIAADIVSAGDLVLRAALPAPAADELGVGFVVMHHGEESVWILADLWSGDIISQLTFSAPLGEPTAFSRVPHGGPTACVHELVVHAHESTSFVRHVLNPPDGPDRQAYLDDVL